MRDFSAPFEPRNLIRNCSKASESAILERSALNSDFNCEIFSSIVVDRIHEKGGICVFQAGVTCGDTPRL